MSKSNVFYSSNKNYTEVPDEELIKMIQNDNNTYALEHLMDRYRNLVNIKVSKYYMNTRSSVQKEKISYKKGSLAYLKRLKVINQKSKTLLKPLPICVLKGNLLQLLKVLTVKNICH